MNWYRHIQIWKRKRLNINSAFFWRVLEASIMQGERQGRQESINPARANRNDCLTAWMNDWRGCISSLHWQAVFCCCFIACEGRACWIMQNAEVIMELEMEMGSMQVIRRMRMTLRYTLLIVRAKQTLSSLDSHVKTPPLWLYIANVAIQFIIHSGITYYHHNHTHVQSRNLQFIDTVR